MTTERNQVEEIRRILKNVNTDEEIDEIHEILDRMSGLVALQNPRVTGLAEDIIRNGMVKNIDIVNHTDLQYSIGGGSHPIDTGPVEATITFAADPRDIYDS